MSATESISHYVDLAYEDGEIRDDVQALEEDIQLLEEENSELRAYLDRVLAILAEREAAEATTATPAVEADQLTAPATLITPDFVERRNWATRPFADAPGTTAPDSAVAMQEVVTTPTMGTAVSSPGQHGTEASHNSSQNAWEDAWQGALQEAWQEGWQDAWQEGFDAGVSAATRAVQRSEPQVMIASEAHVPSDLEARLRRLEDLLLEVLHNRGSMLA
jgi:hypothetical protein